jgi:AraC family transcriptional regulator
MSNPEAIFRAIEFVEAHLQAEIAVADVADAISYSLYHFCRIFNKIVHHTPYDYLIRRRLSEAARELVETDKRIIDLAFDYQFNSSETFSRAFKRMFGVQPSQWRKRGKIDRWSLLSRPTQKYLEHINRGDYLRPVLEEKGALHLAGIMTLVQDDQYIVSRLWKILAQELDAVGDATKPERFYGIVWYPDNWQDYGSLYTAAVEIAPSDTVSPALVARTIPPSKYARFIHKGPREHLPLTRDYIHQTWLPKSEQRPSYPMEIEQYGQAAIGFDNYDTETAIYIPIG